MFRGKLGAIMAKTSTSFKKGDPKIKKLQKQSAESRKVNTDRKKTLYENLDAVIDLVTTPMTDAEFMLKIPQLPNQFQRIYAQDLKDPKTARAVLKELIEQVIGTPKQRVEQQVNETIEYKFKFGE